MDDGPGEGRSTVEKIYSCGFALLTAPLSTLQYPKFMQQPHILENFQNYTYHTFRYSIASRYTCHVIGYDYDSHLVRLFLT